MQIATIRDRVLWITAYYGAVGVLALARSSWMRYKRIPFHFDNVFIPLNMVAFVIPPFALGYQVDLVYFNKSNRIAEEAAKIRSGEPHRWFNQYWLPQSDDSDFWFNQPLELPVALKPAYATYMESMSKAQISEGQLPLKDWARFTPRDA